MTTAQYPPITEASLTPFRAIEIQLKSNPGLLDDAKCPYPPMVKAMLRRLTGDMSVDTTTRLIETMVDPTGDELDREIADLYVTVKNDANTYSGSDMKDKMSFLKTANDLLTKIVDLQGKRINIRNMARAQRALVEAMEGYLTPAQRTEFLTKLESYAND